MKSGVYEHLLGKARDAEHDGEAAWSSQSTGERIAVALILNRADWLASMGYSIGEAIGCLDGDWLAVVPEVERVLRGDRETSLPSMPE